MMAVVLALGVLRVAPSARAESLPGERPANNSTLNQLVALGEVFWHGRGVEPCQQDHLEIMLADMPGVNERAVLGGCELWFPVPLVAYVQAHPFSGIYAAELCSAVVHGLGHTAGLGHTPTGVMAAEWSEGDTPFVCREWMRRRVLSARLTH